MLGPNCPTPELQHCQTAAQCKHPCEHIVPRQQVGSTSNHWQLEPGKKPYSTAYQQAGHALPRRHHYAHSYIADALIGTVPVDAFANGPRPDTVQGWQPLGKDQLLRSRACPFPSLSACCRWLNCPVRLSHDTNPVPQCYSVNLSQTCLDSSCWVNRSPESTPSCRTRSLAALGKHCAVENS